MSAEVAARMAQITALLNAGQLPQAEAACVALHSAHANPASTHLLGLIRAQGGDTEQGERLIRRSLELEPANHEFHLNFANLLRKSGRLAEAETHYRRVLALKPAEHSARHSLALTLDNLGRGAEAEAECRALLRARDHDPQAWAALGFILTNQNRLLEAEAAYARALTLNPSLSLAHQNLGALLARMDRAEESLAALERAEALGGRGFELSFSRGMALTLLYRLPEAERAFAQAVALKPRDVDAQLNLARLRFMRGDADFAADITAAVTAHPQDLGLQTVLSTVLMRAGKLEATETQLRDALQRHGPVPQLRHLLAQVLRDMNRLSEAETEALETAIAMPDYSPGIENLVSILLSRGRPEDALPFIDRQRSREPLGQSWIAYEATAARLLGRPLYRELFDYERVVRQYRIEAPRGWSSMAELNAALGAALYARHRFNSHPLDQSLRHGSQTTRNLIADHDPAIRAILGAFDEPIRLYLQELGRDAGHPLASRNRGAAVMGAAWSVQLYRGGFHVNHFHHQGWISSAYYVSVPDEVQDVALKSGWLKFGEPRFATPGAPPEHYVQPSAGLLVLFPSYMWHGTNAIQGSQLRTTIAFDAVPTQVV
ncbi:MAG TPA: putative 2OG-Fe(II) oxygenase [Steroidobacteraceae bacterium]|nr:putative 2OG-Fe(II) oxygenase [Steroidobacteraceae bacterium]